MGHRMRHSRLIVILSWLMLGLSGLTLADDIKTPKEHIRTPDQTYLTFPEWYLVHSPTEYAEYLKDNKPSQFPYFAHIGQFWDSYSAVHNATKDTYPFNGEYHTMITVIGVSTTAEYGVKGAYELTFGRLTEATRTHGQTDEDRIAANEADKYAKFILELPWYEFDYLESLKSLWGDTAFFGPDMIRKLERKYSLTSEYIIKAFYALLIEKASAASFDAPIHQTAVITTESDLLLLPRYRPFTYTAQKLAQTGTNFEEIAGNKGKVVLSLWATENWTADVLNATTLFSQPIITQSGQHRYVLEIDVADLAEALRTISSSDLRLEHIYDY